MPTYNEVPSPLTQTNPFLHFSISRRGRPKSVTVTDCKISAEVEAILSSIPIPALAERTRKQIENPATEGQSVTLNYSPGKLEIILKNEQGTTKSIASWS